MCGKAYDPRLIFAWPSAQIAVMGGKQASETLLAIRLQQLEKSGSRIAADEQHALLREIQERYEHEAEPTYAAARLWIDGIVDPVETRAIVSKGIAMAMNNPEVRRFNPGVIQT
jgi:acetyl-CoA carboxylase carboxyltransferase component